MPITTTGPLFTLGFWGVVVELLPCDATLSMEVQEAPDTGGDAPDVGNAEIVGTAPPGAIMWVAILSNDGDKRFYRYRHVGPNTLDGEWSNWSDGAAPIVFFFEDLSAQNRPSVVAARTITPTVQAIATVSGGVGTLLLEINDPDATVSKVEFAKWEGATWSSFVEDVVAPFTTTITLQEKHNVIIAWRVTYDRGDGPVLLEDSVAYDLDILPELTNFNVTIDHSTGDVTITYTGDDDTLSIKWHDQATAYASNAAARTAADSGSDDNDGRSDQDIVVESGIAEGATHYVAIVAYTGANGTGTPSTEAYLGAVTRHTDTIVGGAFVPTVKALASVSGNIGTLLLTINDPDGFVDRVQFRKWEGTSWSTYVEDTAAPFTTTITLQEKHNVMIGYEIRYDSGAGDVFIEREATFDRDVIPELSGYSVDIDHATGDVLISYTGDDDTLSIKWHDQSSAYASNAAARTLVDSGSDDNDGQTGQDIVVQSGIGEGVTRYVAIVPYDAASGGGNAGPVAYLGSVTRHIDTDTIPDGAPSADAVLSGGPPKDTVTLTVTDPDGVLTGIGFQVLENNAWSDWVDDTIVPFLAVKTVAIEEKHNTAIGWRLIYDLGGGTQYVYGFIVFDADTIPELSVFNVEVDHSDGDVFLTYVGDDDTQSIEWATSATAWADNNAAKIAALAGTLQDDPSFADLQVVTGIGEGVSYWVAAVGWTGAARTGTSSRMAWVAKVTRHIDTDTNVQVPTLRVAPSVSGTTAKLELFPTETPPDEGGFTTPFRFRHSTPELGPGTWSTFVNESVAPFDHLTPLLEKHNLIIEWEATYDLGLGGGAQIIQDSVTYDKNTTPELKHITIDQDAGVPTVTWGGDDDTERVRWSEATDAAFPSQATAEASGNIETARSFTVGSITVGQTKRVTVVAERTTAPAGFGVEEYQVEVTMPPDTDTLPFGLAEISGISLGVNPTSGDVKLTVVGNENTLSIQWHDQATDYASDAAARTAVEGATTQDPDGQFHRIVVQSGIAEGANRFVAVLAYDAVGGEEGSGAQSVEVYRIDLGRPIDTQPADPSDILPADLPIIPFIAMSGAINFDDVGAANGQIRWDEKVSGAGLKGYNANSTTFTETHLDHTRTPLASTAGRVWVMYGGQNAGRFTGLGDVEERAFPAVQLLTSGQWQYWTGSVWSNFTLDDDDGLVCLAEADSTSGLSRIRMYTRDKFVLDDLADMSEAVVVVEDQSQKFDSSGRIIDDIEMISASSLYIPSTETIRVGNIATPSFISKKILISHAVLISEITTQLMTHVSGGAGYGHNVAVTSGGWKHTHNFVVPEGCKIITVQSRLYRRDNVTSRAIMTLIEVGTAETVTTKVTLTHTGDDPATYQLKSSTPAYVVPADKTWRVTAEIGHNTLATDARYQFSAIFYQMPEYQFGY